MAGSISAVLVITCAFIESLLWGLILCFIAGSLFLWFCTLYWFKIDDGLIPASVLLQEVNIDETLETMDNISQDTLIGQVESKDDNIVHLTVLAPLKNDICSSFTTTPAVSPAKSLNLSSYWTGVSFTSETSSLTPAKEERLPSFEGSAEEIVKQMEPSFSFLIADSGSKQFLNDLSLDIPAISVDQRQDLGDAYPIETSAELVQESVSRLHPESPQAVDEDSLDIKMALAKSPGVADSLLTSSLSSLPDTSFYGDELSRALEFPPKKVLHPDISAEKESGYIDLVAPVPRSESTECISDLSLNHADLDISTSGFSLAVFGASIDLPAPPAVDNEDDSVDIKKILTDFHGASSSSTPTSLLDVGFPSAPSIKCTPRKMSSKKTVASTSRNILTTVSNIAGLAVSSAVSSGSESKKTSSVKPKGKENLRSRLPRVSAIPERTWQTST